MFWVQKGKSVSIYTTNRTELVSGLDTNTPCSDAELETDLTPIPIFSDGQQLFEQVIAISESLPWRWNEETDLA